MLGGLFFIHVGVAYRVLDRCIEPQSQAQTLTRPADYDFVEDIYLEADHGTQ